MNQTEYREMSAVIAITKAEVARTIDSLKNRKASGLDIVSAELLTLDKEGS